MAEYIEREVAIKAVEKADYTAIADDADSCKANILVSSWTEVQTMPELKPCPFCGGEARLFVNDGVRVLCTKCRASSKILVDSECYKTSAVEKVIEAWNRRADNGSN